MEPHRFERDLELRETHLSIRTTLRWIDSGLEPSADPSRPPLGAVALLETLRALESDLELHFELEEHDASSLAPVRGDPRALEIWRGEHRALAEGLRMVVVRLEASAQHRSEVPPSLRSALRAWFAALASHEAAESARDGA